MDISVRYIPTEHGEVDGRAHAFGSKPSLCFVTKTEARCVVNNEVVVEVIRLPPKEVMDSPVPKGYEDIEEGVSHFVTYINTVLKEEKVVMDEVFELLKLVKDSPEEFPEKQNPPEKKKATKPVRTKKAKRNAERREKKKDAKPSVINTLAKEFKVEPTLIRKTLRKAGESAPYEDVKRLTKLLNKELI